MKDEWEDISSDEWEDIAPRQVTYNNDMTKEMDVARANAANPVLYGLKNTFNQAIVNPVIHGINALAPSVRNLVSGAGVPEEKNTIRPIQELDLSNAPAGARIAAGLGGLAGTAAQYAPAWKIGSMLKPGLAMPSIMVGSQVASEEKSKGLSDIEAIGKGALATGTSIIGGKVLEKAGQAIGKGEAYLKMSPIEKAKTKVDESIDYAINKGLRPSVVGKKTFSQRKTFDERAKEAIVDMAENKDKLGFLDESGNVEARLPNNAQGSAIEEMAQAIEKRQADIFKAYDDLAAQSGQKGVTIKTKTLIDKILKPIVNDKSLAKRKPEVVNWAERQIDSLNIDDVMTPSQAQARIKEWNNDLKTSYKSGDFGVADKQAYLKEMVENLRSDLDKAISSTEGPGYQELKRLYGAYKALGNEVSHRLTVSKRASPKGFFDLADLMASGDIMQGATQTLTGAPQLGIPNMIKGVAIKGARNYFGSKNDPNVIIEKMFKDVDKFHIPAKKTFTPEIITPQAGPARMSPLGLPNLVQKTAANKGQMGAFGDFPINPVKETTAPINLGQTKTYTPGESAQIIPGPMSGINPLKQSQKGTTGDFIDKARTLGIAGAVGLSALAGPASAGQLKDSDRLVLPAHEYTQKEEGFEALPYIDSRGIRTVGYGFNMTEPSIAKLIPKAVLDNKRPMTKQEADVIFSKVYSIAKRDAQKFSGDAWLNLNENQRKALVDMAYQLGSSKLNGFKNLKKAIQGGNFNTASREILNSNYARQVKNRANRNAKLIRG